MRRLLSVLWLCCWPAVLFAAERFPPPEFDNGYLIPTSQYPLPRAAWFAWLDTGLLLLALSASAYFALRARSRRGVVGVMLASLAYFGFYRHGCICPIGAIQNVTLAVADHSYALPVMVAAFFLLPLLFALFVGRAFCAGACPLGAIQDLVLLKPVRVPAWLEHALGLLAYVYLGAAVLFTATGTLFLICKYDPFVAFFRLGGSGPMLLVGTVMLVIGVFVGRPYCRFLCPYGVLLRWLAPLARWRVSVTPTTCVQCRLCENVCPFGIIRYPTPDNAPRREGKSRLALLLVLLPVFLLAGGGLGYLGSGVLADYQPNVRLLRLLHESEGKKADDLPLEVQAFHQLMSSREQVEARAVETRRQFATGGLLLGLWIGLLVGLKLISLSIRRKRTDYEPDQAACFACARCYRYCPQEPRGCRR